MSSTHAAPPQHPRPGPHPVTLVLPPSCCTCVPTVTPSHPRLKPRPLTLSCRPLVPQDQGPAQWQPAGGRRRPPVGAVQADARDARGVDVCGGGRMTGGGRGLKLQAWHCRGWCAGTIGWQSQIYGSSNPFGASD
eukprot:38402-Chlamydomonas_euryale.AAC.1